MFQIAIILMILGSITPPRRTNLRTPRTVRVSKPVPLESIFDGIAGRIMLAARISTLLVPKHLRRCGVSGSSHPNL